MASYRPGPELAEQVQYLENERRRLREMDDGRYGYRFNERDIRSTRDISEMMDCFAQELLNLKEGFVKIIDTQQKQIRDLETEVNSLIERLDSEEYYSEAA